MSARSAFSAAAAIMRDIKLAHTVFAMPFALLGAALGWASTPEAQQTPGRAALQFGLVIVCMVAARTWAMVVNRMADRRIDASNPRTAKRVFASGEVGQHAGVAALALSGGVFVLACAGFGLLFGNWWPIALSLPVLAWIGGYSFTKRVTWLCHLVLGSALAASPLSAALAVEPAAVTQAMGVWWIAAMVLCWVAGFDVVYALQDLEFDRGEGLSSIPARFGWRGAVWVSRVLHAACLVFLWLAIEAEPGFRVLTMLGALLTAGLLVAEHAVLTGRGREGIPMVFFTFNGVVSIVLCALAITDVLLTA